MEHAEALYDRGYLIDFGNGEIVLHRHNIFYTQSVEDRYHVIREGETLQQIARIYYTYSSLWFILADVNVIIDDIFDLPVGYTILIPNLFLIQSSYA